MTLNRKTLILLVAVGLMPLMGLAQISPPPPPGEPVPISEGIVFLLISGIIYGFRKKIKG